MQLSVDIGNTYSKAGLYQDGVLMNTVRFAGDDPAALIAFISENGTPAATMLSAVRPVSNEFVSALQQICPVHFLSHETPLPFTITYASPESLGRDRIAGVAAAYGRFPGQNVLVVDMGTCITYDILKADGSWPGGIISPGIRMRLQAMHHFTGQLPLIELPDETPLTGTTTAQALASGALCGARAEMNGIIEAYKAIYEDLTVLIGGGDNNYFDKKLRISIFAAPNLVIDGLKTIMDFNNLR